MPEVAAAPPELTHFDGRHCAEACQGVVLLATCQDDCMHLLPDVVIGQAVNLAQSDLPLQPLAGRLAQAAVT